MRISDWSSDVCSSDLCEIADEARREKQDDIALRHVRRALAEDGDCVRAHLQLGVLLEAREQFAAAAEAYLRAFELAPRFLPAVIEPLYRCSPNTQLGRASCRERVCQYVSRTGVA